MNILTFDTEEWFLQYAYLGNHSKAYSRYDGYLSQILDALEENKLKATFFCVGGMARFFPKIIKLIDSRGHEIGCHSDKHTWLNKMNRTELFEDTRMAIDSLEDVLGKKVISYRAPAFTIGEKNKYALEVLTECGIERDASIFPAVHAFGGFERFSSTEPCQINVEGVCLKEFPISTTKIFGKTLAYSGGGYFRLFPLWFVLWQMKKHQYNMTYFHIYDLIKAYGMDKKTFESYYKIPATWKNRKIRDFKNNVGADGAFDKLLKLLSSIDFINLDQADKHIDWKNAPSITL